MQYISHPDPTVIYKITKLQNIYILLCPFNKWENKSMEQLPNSPDFPQVKVHRNAGTRVLVRL